MSYIELISTMLCVYGSQALLTASKEILKEYKIDGKFKVIQFGFLTLSLPSAIVGIINIDNENDIYTAEIISTAYASVCSCVIFMLLSFGFVYYFNEQTANEAYRNMRNQSFVVPEMDKKEPVENAGNGDGDNDSNEANQLMESNENFEGKDPTENDIELQTQN